MKASDAPSEVKKRETHGGTDTLSIIKTDDKKASRSQEDSKDKKIDSGSDSSLRKPMPFCVYAQCFCILRFR
jgi:hypothetical protein